MRKQLFYKDLFDALGNPIPVLTDTGAFIVIGDAPIHTTQCGSCGGHAALVDPQFGVNEYYPLVDVQLSYEVSRAYTIYFDTYKVIQVNSDLFARQVNCSYNGKPFVQTYSTYDGELWIQHNEIVDQITIEFNGVVKHVPVEQCI